MFQRLYLCLNLRRIDLENHQQINQDSGNTEWYTPPEIIEAARKALGGMITLDPFSCAKANRNVQAFNYFTKEDDGWSKPWHGAIWCNHPFSKENNKKIVGKVIQEYEIGNTKALCMITFAATSEGWFKPLLAYPQCYIYGRTQYIDEHGNKTKGVTKGSVVTYLGNDVEMFYQAFKHLGEIKVSYGK